MRTFNFTLLAVFGYVAVIGASPLGVRAPAESVDRRDPPYCDKYPDGTGCSTACRVNPFQKRCEDLCDQDLHLSFCPGAPPPAMPGKSRALVEGVGRREYPYCDEHPSAPGCGGSDAPSCRDDPFQQSCVDLCKKDPKLSFCDGSSAVTPPADPAPALDVRRQLKKSVDRRQYPYCNDNPSAPGCYGSDAPSCYVYPFQKRCAELCKKDLKWSFCDGFSAATPPAGPAPAKDV